VIARPSGTEPKVKFYFFLRETDFTPQDDVKRETIEERYARLAKRKDEFQAAFLDLVGMGD
jgi:phosphomannomutase